MPANAEVGSIPGLGKIPHGLGQLSCCTTNPEPVLESLKVETIESSWGSY